MLDLAIVLALVVLNAFAHSAYIRWRKAPKARRPRQPARPRLAYPTHPSPGFADVAEYSAAVRPVGIDW